MPDLLLVPSDQESVEKVSIIAKSFNMRLKIAYESSQAIKWLMVRSFDALLLHSSITIIEQEQLGSLLWDKNPIASLLIIDFKTDNSALHRKARLFGAELAAGSKALDIIRDTIGNLLKKSPVSDRDLTILVVEDLDAPREIICAYIERMGYQSVIGFSSAQSTLDFLNQGNTPKWCVIITDIRMPHISGDEFIRIIRSIPKLSHLPIIVLTAHGTADCLMSCLSAGASGFLVKPPKKEALRREIQRSLRILSGRLPCRLVASNELEHVQEMLFGEEL